MKGHKAERLHPIDGKCAKMIATSLVLASTAATSTRAAIASTSARFLNLQAHASCVTKRNRVVPFPHNNLKGKWECFAGKRIPTLHMHPHDQKILPKVYTTHDTTVERHGCSRRHHANTPRHLVWLLALNRYVNTFRNTIPEEMAAYQRLKQFLLQTELFLTTPFIICHANSRVPWITVDHVSRFISPEIFLNSAPILKSRNISLGKSFPS